MPPRDDDPMTREEQGGALRARFLPETVDAEARTVDITWGTGAPVMRVDWWSGDRYIEELSMDPAHVRLEFLDSGRAPFTRDHARGIDNVLAVIVRANIKDGEGRATVKFSRRPDAAGSQGRGGRGARHSWTARTLPAGPRPLRRSIILPLAQGQRGVRPEARAVLAINHPSAGARPAGGGGSHR